MRERDLEDWICNNPKSIHEDVEILGRQVVLPNGILDILAWDGNILVIELKARSLQSKDVAQVLRYAGDIGDMLRAKFSQVGPCPYPFGTPQFQQWVEYSCMGQHDPLASCAIEPVLIGPKLDDRVIATAAGAGCTIFLWKYGPPTYATLQIEHFMPAGKYQPEYEPIWLSILFDKIQETMNTGT